MTIDPAAMRGVELAAAYCRLHLLGDVEGRVELLKMANEGGTATLSSLIESLAAFAVKEKPTGRGGQPIETRQQLLNYFEDLAAVSAMDGGAS